MDGIDEMGQDWGRGICKEGMVGMKKKEDKSRRDIMVKVDEEGWREVNSDEPPPDTHHDTPLAMHLPNLPPNTLNTSSPSLPTSSDSDLSDSRQL